MHNQHLQNQHGRQVHLALDDDQEPEIDADVDLAANRILKEYIENPQIFAIFSDLPPKIILSELIKKVKEIGE